MGKDRVRLVRNCVRFGVLVYLFVCCYCDQNAHEHQLDEARISFGSWFQVHHSKKGIEELGSNGNMCRAGGR